MRQIIDAISNTLFAIKHPPIKKVAGTRQQVTAYYNTVHLGSVVVHFHDLSITPATPTVVHVEFRAEVHLDHTIPKSPSGWAIISDNGELNFDISGVADTYEALADASYRIFKRIVDMIRENYTAWEEG